MPTWEYGHLLVGQGTVPVKETYRKGLRRRTTFVQREMWTGSWVTSQSPSVSWTADTYSGVLAWLAGISNDGWDLISADAATGQYLFRRFNQA